MDNLRLRTVMATALLLIAGVWTVGARAQSKKNGGEWVRVIAFTNTPVADADIVVSDRDGRVVFEKDHVTNDRGFYAAEIHPVPKNFRVTVISDAMRLSSDVHDYDRVHGVVYVNPVTTMVSRLLDRRPELSLAEAQAIVRRVLGMPANTSLGAAMREEKHYQYPYFSESKFINQANAYGGFDGFVGSLVTQAIDHPNETRLFRGNVAQNLTGEEDPAVDVGVALAEGALKYLGGQGVGWAASAAGILEDGTTNDDIKEMQAKLDSLQSSIDALTDQLTESTQEITAAIDYADYNTLTSAAIKLANQVVQTEGDVDILADGCPPATSQSGTGLDKFCKTQKALVISELSESEIHASFEEFANAYLLDTAAVGNKGLLHLFSLCTGEAASTNGRHFFRYADSVTIYNQFYFWDSVEVSAANLKVELMHLQDAQDDETGKKQLIKFLGDVSENPASPTPGEMQNTHNAELQLEKRPLFDGSVVNTLDNNVWMTTFPSALGGPDCKTPLVSPGPPAPNVGGVATQPLYPAILVKSVDASNVLPYRSPTKDEVASLIKGWTGDSPNGWLVGQTSARPGDLVPSIPFKNFAQVKGCSSNVTTDSSYVWTITGSSNGDEVMSFSFGVFANPSSGAGVPNKNQNWLLLVLQQQQGDHTEYYWSH